MSMGDNIPRPDGPDNNLGKPFVELIWSLYSVAIIVVGLRIYAQARFIRHIGWADGLMVLSLCCGLTYCSLLTAAWHNGFGRHMYFLTPEERIYTIKYIYLNEPFAILTGAFGRISFILLMYRLFGTTKVRRWFLIALIAQSAIVNSATAIAAIAQCPNINTLWDPVGYPGTCWSPAVQLYTNIIQGSMNSATDFTLTIIPAYVFWGLQMTRKTKFGLMAVLGLSVFAFMASIRKVSLLKDFNRDYDYTYDTVEFYTWITVENTLVIITASVALIRPIFIRSKDASTTKYELSAQSRNYAHGRASKHIVLSSGQDPTEFGRENARASRSIFVKANLELMELGLTTTHSGDMSVSTITEAPKTRGTESKKDRDKEERALQKLRNDGVIVKKVEVAVTFDDCDTQDVETRKRDTHDKIVPTDREAGQDWPMRNSVHADQSGMRL